MVILQERETEVDEERERTKKAQKATGVERKKKEHAEHVGTCSEEWSVSNSQLVVIGSFLRWLAQGWGKVWQIANRRQRRHEGSRLQASPQRHAHPTGRLPSLPQCTAVGAEP